MKKENSGTEKEPEEFQENGLLLNIGKIAFLIAVLAAAWFILERLMK